MGAALSLTRAGPEQRKWRKPGAGERHLFLFSEKGHTGACGQAGGSRSESLADILLVTWLGAGFQQGVPGACLLPILGLAGLGVGDSEARVDAALHVVLSIGVVHLADGVLKHLHIFHSKHFCSSSETDS